MRPRVGSRGHRPRLTETAGKHGGFAHKDQTTVDVINVRTNQSVQVNIFIPRVEGTGIDLPTA